MKAKSLIQVIASEPLPELNDKYEQWYKEIQIPALFKNPNLLAVSFYRIVSGLSDPTHPGLAEPEEGYAKYLAVLEFESEERFRLFDSGLEMEEALAHEAQTWRKGDIAVKFRAEYKLKATRVSKMRAKVGLIHITAVILPPEAEKAFNRFYYEKTIPTIFANPRLLRADNYELVKNLARTDYPFITEPKAGYPKYFNIFRLESVDSFLAYEHSSEIQTNSENFSRFLELWPPGTFKVTMRTEYVPIKVWGR